MSQSRISPPKRNLAEIILEIEERVQVLENNFEEVIEEELIDNIINERNDLKNRLKILYQKREKMEKKTKSKALK